MEARLSKERLLGNIFSFIIGFSFFMLSINLLLKKDDFDLGFSIFLLLIGGILGGFIGFVLSRIRKGTK